MMNRGLGYFQRGHISAICTFGRSNVVEVVIIQLVHRPFSTGRLRPGADRFGVVVIVVVAPEKTEEQGHGRQSMWAPSQACGHLKWQRHSMCRHEQGLDL